MTYTESADLMKDQVFIGRVKVSGLSYSNYILNESPDVQGHSARYRWAQKFSSQPDIEAHAITPMVVMDAAVQSAGADITDAALQSAVEGVVNKIV